MLPLPGGVTGIRAHHVRLVGLNADLVDARNLAPEIDKVAHLAGVPLHLDHLHHYLQMRTPLAFQLREADEVVAHLLELSALTVELERLFLRAVEAEGNLLQRGIEN